MTIGNYWVELTKWHYKDHDDTEQSFEGEDTGVDGTIAGQYWVEETYWHYIDQNLDERRKEGILTGETGIPGQWWIEDDCLHYIDANGEERYIALLGEYYDGTRNTANACQTVWVYAQSFTPQFNQNVSQVQLYVAGQSAEGQPSSTQFYAGIYEDKDGEPMGDCLGEDTISVETPVGLGEWHWESFSITVSGLLADTVYWIKVYRLGSDYWPIVWWAGKRNNPYTRGECKRSSDGGETWDGDVYSSDYFFKTYL